jgi:hypothetical protein
LIQDPQFTDIARVEQKVYTTQHVEENRGQGAAA